jgi:hypothetical protein
MARQTLVAKSSQMNLFAKIGAYVGAFAGILAVSADSAFAQVAPAVTSIDDDAIATIFNGFTDNMGRMIVIYLPILLGLGVSIWALRWVIGKAYGYFRGL